MRARRTSTARHARPGERVEAASTGVWGARTVGRQCRQALVLHRAAGSEMVQALPAHSLESKQPVHFVVEEAADAGGANSSGLRLEVQHLPDQAALPVEAAVHPRRGL